MTTTIILIIGLIVVLSIIIVLVSELNDYLKRRSKLREKDQDAEKRKQLQQQYTKRH